MSDEAFNRCQYNHDNATPYDNEPDLEPSVPYDVEFLCCPHCDEDRPMAEYEKVDISSYEVVKCPNCDALFWVTD